MRSRTGISQNASIQGLDSQALGGHTPLLENRRRLGRRDTEHISGNWIDYRHRMVGTQPCRCRIVVKLSGMETGSRFFTTITILIWLPNVMLWAVSWLFGGGFAIGDLASFTLWLGQSKELPAIPVFGILPEPVSSDLWRTVALNAPLAIAALVGLLAVFLPQGFACRPLNIRNTSTRGPVLVSLIYSAGAFCLSAMLISLASTLLFALSNGSLGDHRLAHIGVDVMASTRVVGHSTALGLTAAWLLALIGTALVFPIIWLVERIKDSRTTAATSKTATVRQARFLASQPQESKEEQDDKHEPTDTSSTGLGLS